MFVKQRSVHILKERKLSITLLFRIDIFCCNGRSELVRVSHSEGVVFSQGFGPCGGGRGGRCVCVLSLWGWTGRG